MMSNNHTLATFLLAVFALLSVAKGQINVYSPFDNSCLINGRLYARGEEIEDQDMFETRCGPVADFPCICNPDKLYQVDCPYCSFATSTPNYVRCARHEEEVSFISITGVGQTCTCDASDPGNPISSCQDDPNAELCSVTTEDDNVLIRLPGQEIGTDEFKCGDSDDYPCFCNPNLPDQIECNYCTVNLQLSNGEAGVACMNNNETKIVKGLDDITRTCGCELPDSLAFPPAPFCDGEPTLPPVDPDARCVFPGSDGGEITFLQGEQLEVSDDRCGADYPCFCNAFSDNQVDCPYCAVELNDGSGGYLCGGDEEVLQIPQSDGTTWDCQCQVGNAFSKPALVCGIFPTAAPKATCEVELPNGQTTSAVEGESLSFPIGPCGEDFPYICNPALDDGLEFPFCQVAVQGGGTDCVKDGSSITFTNTQGQVEECDCTYLNAGLGPQTSCRLVANPVPAATPAPVPALVEATPAPVGMFQSSDAKGRTTFGIAAAVTAMTLLLSSFAP